MNGRNLIVAWLAAGLLAAACGDAPLEAAEEIDPRAAEIAAQLLDEERAQQERVALVRDHPELSRDLLLELTRDIEPGTEEEYRRIPWIWRVTIAAGERNDAGEIIPLLEISLPERDAPLYDWQAVVLGGGIVNGISRSGEWPRERIDEILSGRSDLQARWHRSVEASFPMADDESVNVHTRYDALRMIGVAEWDRSLPHLVSYLAEGVDDELRVGAVAGLSDSRHPDVAEILLAELPRFSDRVRNSALNALMRTDDRVEALLDAVEAGAVSPADLGEQRIERLMNHENEAIRQRAVAAFPT